MVLAAPRVADRPGHERAGNRRRSPGPARARALVRLSNCAARLASGWPTFDNTTVATEDRTVSRLRLRRGRVGCHGVRLPRHRLEYLVDECTAVDGANAQLGTADHAAADGPTDVGPAG